MIRHTLLGLPVATLLFASWARAQGPPPCSYQIRDLGVLPGGSQSTVADLNDLGQVVGKADRAGGASVAFLWLPSPAYGLPAGMNDLGHLPTRTEARAWSINALGQVSGTSSDVTPGTGRGFVWLPAPALGFATAGMHDIGTLGGGETYVGGMNDAGRIVGGSTTSGSYSPFRWDAGVMTNLGSLGGICGSAHGVNSLGEITGSSWLAGCGGSNQLHAWLWLPAAKYGLTAGLNDLGTLGGSISEGNGVNDRGEVAGRSTVASGDLHPFLWLPAPAYGLPAGMNDLGGLGGNDGSAEFIDDTGTVLGWSETSTGARHGFIWAQGLMVDVNDHLQTSGWTVQETRAMNASGQIAATALSPSGETRAVLLEPTGTAVTATETTRLGTPPNPNAFLPGVTTRPILAATWDPVVDHTGFAPGALADFVAFSLLGPANVATSLGTLLIPPPAGSQIRLSGPGTPFAIPIPNDCSFVGVNVWTQGGSVSPGPLIELANALDLVLGNL